MQEIEMIPVYVAVGKNGLTKCICAQDRKGCNKDCPPDLVTRDRFLGWQEVMHRDKCGRSRDAPVRSLSDKERKLERSEDP